MDYNNLNNSSDDTKYRATRNLNTALENPQFNVGDTLDVNLSTTNVNESADFENKDNTFGNNIGDTLVETNNVLDDNLEKKEVDSVNTSFDNNSYNSVSNSPVDSDDSFSANSYDLSTGEVGNGNTFVNSGNVDNNQFNNYTVDINSSNSFSDEVSNTSGNKATYMPTGKKKKKKVSLTIPAELKILIILVIIILVFIFVIPNLYELFRSIRLSILLG